MPISDYRTAIVAGASSGIGAETAIALLQRGLEVHALARRKERLQTLFDNTGAVIHELDVRRLALQGSWVKVTEICPGHVKTEFYDVAIDDPAQRDQIKKSGIHELAPDDVAQAVLYALDTPRHVNVNLIELQPTE